jgi:hypothetical protein
MNLLEQGTEDQISIDENKNYLEELVGDGRKFKSPEELARGKYLADMHIVTLERKADQLREDYIKLREEHMARTKIEDLLNQRLSQPDNTSIPDRPSQTWDPAKIESLVSTKMQEFETQKKQSENFNLVKNKLRERYGDNYQPYLNQQMTQLGLDADSLNNMARTQPNILVKALNLDISAPSYDNNLPRSSVRTDQFAPKVEKRTWSYYENIRKTDPTRYYSPKITTQMEQDYQRLGTDFEDGDFGS